MIYFVFQWRSVGMDQWAVIDKDRWESEPHPEHFSFEFHREPTSFNKESASSQAVVAARSAPLPLFFIIY